MTRAATDKKARAKLVWLVELTGNGINMASSLALCDVQNRINYPKLNILPARFRDGAMNGLTILFSRPAGRQFLLLIAATTMCSLLAPAKASGDPAGIGFLEKLSVSVQASSVLTICHGFGCAYRDQLVLTPARIAHLRATLRAASSAAAERKALAKVVSWFDREGGRVAGTTGRIAYAGVATKSGPSQMDCIDLTANITGLLILLERSKLLRFHSVGEPVSRGFIVDGRQPHTTPVIVETANGSQWSVDSWTKAYGQNPDIMPISGWQSKK